MEDFTFKKAFSISLKQFKSNFLILIALPLLLNGLTFLSYKVSFWFSIPSLLFSCLITYWLVQLAIKINQKGKLSLKEGFTLEKRGIFRSFLGNALQLVIALVFLGLILVLFAIIVVLTYPHEFITQGLTNNMTIIIIGSIATILVFSFAFIRFVFYNYFIYDKDLDTLDSMDKTWKLSYKKIVPLIFIGFIYILLTSGIGIIANRYLDSNIFYILFIIQAVISTLLFGFISLLMNQYYLKISENEKIEKKPKFEKAAFKIPDVIKESVKKLFKSFGAICSWNLIMLACLIAVFFVLTSLASINERQSSKLINVTIAILLLFSYTFVLPVFTYFVIQISLKISGNIKVKFSQLKPTFKGFKDFLAKFWFFYLLFFAILMICYAPVIIQVARETNPNLNSTLPENQLLIGLLSFIGVLCFWAMYIKANFTLYSATFKKKSVFLCLKESIEITPFWKTVGLNLLVLLMMGGAFLGATIIGAILTIASNNPFVWKTTVAVIITPIFFLLFIPFGIIVQGVTYRTLSKNKEPDLSEDKASSDIPVQNNLEIE